MIRLMMFLVFALMIVGVVIVIAAVLSRKKTAGTGNEESYFDGSTWQLIGYRLLSALVNAITLGIAYPWMLCMVQRWEVKHTVIHGRRLKFNGRGHQLIGKYLLWVFLTIITFGIYGIWLGLGMKKWVVKHTVYADEEKPVDSYFSGGAGGYLGIHILSFILTVFTIGIGKAWADKMVLKWETKHTHIGGSPLEFNGTGGQLFVKYLLLVLLTPLTLGIYALFFTVIYKKWEVKHTEAVYQTPQIQAKAKAHEMTAVQDFAKYRIAANDQEIAAMKSGYTGKEDLSTLEQMAEDGNPFAAYHLAKQLKGETAIYEDRALELLQKAANGKVHSALLDLAKQSPTDQRASMLTEAARCGNAEASWLLAVAYKDANNLPQAAYWFKIAMEWGVAEATARTAEYDETVKNIALQLSENRVMPQQSKVLPIVLGVVGAVLLAVVAFGVMAIFGLRFGSFGRPAASTSIGIGDVEIVLTVTGDDVEGEHFKATDSDGCEYEYVLSKDVFYDDDEQVLYFVFSKEQGDHGMFLCLGDHWRTEAIGTGNHFNGIFKVDYPYGYSPTIEVSVREENGTMYGSFLKFHTLNVTRGTTAEAEVWIEEKNPYEDQKDNTTTVQTTPTAPSSYLATELLLGQWVGWNGSITQVDWMGDGIMSDMTGCLFLEFFDNGTFTDTTRIYFVGENTSLVEAVNADIYCGTYTLEGNTLTLQYTHIDYPAAEPTEPINKTETYTIEIIDGILHVDGLEYCDKLYRDTAENVVRNRVS